ncbi:SDR family NAD(P)-dependent oxidoreductase [Labilithrix luteola]|nr:SDR family NAD(P)-dependent oxidoreductase [Labilithrix luteola]
MDSLEGKRVLVTGGNRGLGLGIVEALVAKKARVTALARDADKLMEVKRRLGVGVLVGDITDQAIAAGALREVRPDVLILNAGTTPAMGPIHELDWDAFSKTWNIDVKATLFWIQEALRLPLASGSRVLLGSSGAAIAGSPMSGGHGGAKRMIMFMANYANVVSNELGRGIRFQTLVPRQMIGETDHGRACAGYYADRKGVSLETFLQNFGKPMSPREYGEYVVTILTDPKFDSTTTFAIKGDTGIVPFDGSQS